VFIIIIIIIIGYIYMVGTGGNIFNL